MPIALESTTPNTTVIQEAGNGSYTLTLPSKTDYLANRGYVDGIEYITPATDTDVTLTTAQAAAGVLVIQTGAWTQARNIIVPNSHRIFWIVNSSSYDATIKTAAGGGIVVYALRANAALCDGAAVYDPTTQVRGIGFDQTWQNVIGSRASGVTYYNTTPKSILVSVSMALGNNTNSFAISVDGVVIQSLVNISNTNGRYAVSAIVPPGSSYVVNASLGIAYWSELR